jgi:TBC1 domain family member 20
MKYYKIDESHYSLSWIITWFSHVIDDVKIISRIFDFLLSSHPIVYYYY